MRSITLVACAVLGGALGLTAGGCFLSTTGEGTSPDTCNQTADCPDDSNPCAKPICDNGFCAAEPVNDGLAPDQVGGDCKTARCIGGEETVEDEPNDFDDGNPCTEDACLASGEARHEAVPVGGACEVGAAQGECNREGQCVISCSELDPCGDVGICREAHCVNFVCEIEILVEPPASVLDPANDCKKPACDQVTGELVDMANPADPPASDDNDCTTEGCNGSDPVDGFVDTDVPCATGVCDGAGNCVQCTPTKACQLALGECNYQTCDAGVCNDHATAEGEACRVTTDNLCDSAGNCVACLDAMDCGPPPGLCTRWVCSGTGTCSQQNVPTGGDCTDNSGNVCTNSQMCVECVDQFDCTDPIGPCEKHVCRASGVCDVDDVVNGMGCGGVDICCDGMCITGVCL